MKKIIVILFLVLNLIAFAQKDELKTLKKIYDREIPSTSDIVKYKEALKSLETTATTEEDKVYTNFYAGMLPFMEIASLGEKVTPQDQMRIFTPKALENFSTAINQTLEFEKKSGNKLYTDDINETLGWFKPMVKQLAFQLNNASKFKEAANLFYNIYLMDKKDGSNIENAAILAVQTQDYKAAEKYYKEFIESDYLKNGKIYYATNKASDKEEVMESLQDRSNKLKMGTHEKPRDENASDKKPNAYKIYAILVAQNGDLELAKKVYKEAKELNPDDLELLNGEANLYYQTKDMVTYKSLIKEIAKKNPNNASMQYNIGYLSLSDDGNIVDEINKNLDKPKVYAELIEKRKAIYQEALPYFEQSYKLDPTNNDTKTILKATYEVLGMKEKAAKL
jgi:tetratricopeptide (TPR) repeat protein